MIRINLLPIRKEQQRESGRRQLILFAVILLLQCLALYPVYASKSNELETITDEVTTKQKQVAKLKAEAKDVEKLSAEIEQLEAQLSVLDELEAGRSGPVRVLDEVQKILSSPRNDLARLDFEKRGWNPRWDPSRLWFNSFNESNGRFRLQGGARTADDVAEFMLRLQTSVFFDDVKLLQSTETGKKDFKYTQFSIEGDLSYTVEKAAGGEGG